MELETNLSERQMWSRFIKAPFNSAFSSQILMRSADLVLDHLVCILIEEFVLIYVVGGKN